MEFMVITIMTRHIGRYDDDDDTDDDLPYTA